MSKNSRRPRALSIQTGYVKRHPDGFGFFISDDSEQPDVYIPRHEMSGVMTSDRIKVEIRPEKGGDRFRGSVLSIIERSLKTVTGHWHHSHERWGMIPDKGHSWGEDLKVEAAEVLPNEGDWVQVDILSYPGSEEGFIGRVKAILGDMEDPYNDNFRVLMGSNIPYEFSSAAQKEMQMFSPDVSAEDYRERRDLRDLPFVTIDGQTAKDFDDAIFVETTPAGFRLYVGIADVSHYVKPGTAIDDGAYKRGTSTYFPGFVAPMLPEILSNELCSLRPHIPRLSLVAEMEFDFQGELLKKTFYEAVIQSHSRITYGEAQEIIDGEIPEIHKHVANMVVKAADFANVLMAKRFREGSLDLEISETEVEVDESGQPLDIIRSERLFSHRLIEEMMLVANVAVALFFHEKKISAMYRVHEAPEMEDVEKLESFLFNFGLSKKLGGGKLQKKMSRALEEFKGRPEEQVLHIMALRTMKQAKYSSENIGHFGLGFSFYTHFTSPIRRYPDLIVHRLLKALVQPKSGYRLMAEDDLRTAGTILSACEQRSVKAERQLVSIKKARFMRNHLGETLEGIISSVAKFGVFVLLRKFDVDGLIKVEELGGDRFEFDDENLRLVGNKSGMSYSIGQALTVKVVRVDIDLGQIDFTLAEGTSFVAAEPKKAKSTSKRRKAKNNSERVRKARVRKSSGKS